MRVTDPDRKRGPTFKLMARQVEVAMAVLEKQEQEKEEANGKQ